MNNEIVDGTSPRPLISVILPVHNGEEFLEEALESIISQTFQDFELLLIDDGSTDKTSAIAERFRERDTRVHYQKLPQVGLVAALNVALRLAGAPIVARMDADDIADPKRLQIQYEYLQEHPEVAVVSSAVEQIGSTGRIAGVSVVGPRNREEFEEQKRSISIIFTHPAVMFRKEAVLSAGGYSDRYPAAEDYELWNRLASDHYMVTLPIPLLKYRIHDAATGTAKMREQTRSWKRAKLDITRCRAGLPPLTDDQFQRLLRNSSFTDRLCSEVSLRSRDAYRRAGGKLASDDYSGFIWLAYSLLLNPFAGVRKLRGQRVLSTLISKLRR